MDYYPEQNTFDKPTKLPYRANLLHLLWTYIVKDDDTKKINMRMQRIFPCERFHNISVASKIYCHLQQLITMQLSVQIQQTHLQKRVLQKHLYLSQ